MCGIFAYTGNKKAEPILLTGLSSLEYRGYDSAGIFMPGTPLVKTPGAVDALKMELFVFSFNMSYLINSTIQPCAV
jgi:glucosamine--fructose-6-phosphate aminotransferase (isomerizing)